MYKIKQLFKDILDLIVSGLRWRVIDRRKKLIKRTKVSFVDCKISCKNAARACRGFRTLNEENNLNKKKAHFFMKEKKIFVHIDVLNKLSEIYLVV